MMATISSKRKDEKRRRDGAELGLNMMAHSGARGSVTQMKQLGGMRGLMAKPSGEIIETPIISNFKEGLTVLEYFNSTHGARKGLSDTALKTANSGYLTRRLVDVAQDCIVRMNDCGTENTISASAAVNDGEVVASLAERILGRTAGEDILVPGTDEVIVAKGELIDERRADAVETAGVQVVAIRSPLTCEAEEGVCATCYGRDLARGTKVNTGEAVGIIAAQSIGEPGTQLTMRTFHIGGVAQGGQQSFQEVNVEGKVNFANPNLLKNAAGEQIVMGRNMTLVITDDQGDERASFKAWLRHQGPGGGRADRVARRPPVRMGPLHSADHRREGGHGEVRRPDVRRVDPRGNRRCHGHDPEDRVRLAHRAQGQRAQARDHHRRRRRGEPVRNEQGNPVTYTMSVDAILSVEDGAGDRGPVTWWRGSRARAPRPRTSPAVCRGWPNCSRRAVPKDHAIIAEIDGYVKFGRDFKNKRRISIVPADDSIEPVEYMVPKGKHIPVAEGDFVQKGDYIMDGNPAPHDILRIMGIEALAGYLIDEVQDVYRLQGVKINDKHIEVIVRQMLQKWEILDSGETTLLKGEHVDKAEFEAANEKAIAKGGRPAQGEPILLGITKASLQTRSFISAASFQETTRVLTEASVQGKRDKLVGLKENVIVGRLIPAGTGGATQARAPHRGPSGTTR